MTTCNPFESPQSEVTSNRAPTWRPAARMLRATFLGIFGYAIYTGVVCLSGLYIGSFEELPRDVWVRGIFVVMAFAGTELFVNSRRRSGVRRLAYSMVTLFFGAILGDMLLQVIPQTSFFPHRSQAAADQIRVVLIKAFIFGLIFVVCASVLNSWRSRRLYSETPSGSERDDKNLPME